MQQKRIVTITIRQLTGILQMIGDWSVRLAPFGLFGKAERPLPFARPACCKTATFLQLCQTHFGGSEDTAFAFFQRDGYVLVPIKTRRFPEVPYDEKR